MRARSNGTGERSCSTSARCSASAAASRSPCAASRRPRQRADTARLQGIRDRAARSSKRMTSRSARSSVADGDGCLDRVPIDAPDRRLAEVHQVELGQRLREVTVGGFQLAGGQLGQSVAAAPDHRDDRFARPLPGGGAHGVEATGVRVQICAPRVDPLGFHTELLERVAHLSGELSRMAPPARPRLDHDAIEQDVGQRRIVPLVARRLLGLGEPRPRAVQVVDVPQPLPELEDEPRVDRRGRGLALEAAAPAGPPLRRSPCPGRGPPVSSPRAPGRRDPPRRRGAPRAARAQHAPRLPLS